MEGEIHEITLVVGGGVVVVVVVSVVDEFLTFVAFFFQLPAICPTKT